MQAELYWITTAPEGRLAIMPRPRGGDWLADELMSLQSSGVQILVSLLCEDEIRELALDHEATLCEEVGLAFFSYPIDDRGVPESVDDFLASISQLHEYLRDGRGIAIHCRMGIGRSSLVAACLLAKSGLSVPGAFDCISRDRGMDVPDTSAQIEWVESISSRLRRGTAIT